MKKIIAIRAVIGSEFCPKGIIKLWQGDKVPAGWEECKEIKITEDMFKNEKSPHGFQL